LSDPTPSGLVPLARLYTDIAFFRRGPEDVPFSRRSLGVTVLAYVLLSLLLSNLMPAVPGSRVALIAVDCALAFAWYWVVLKLAGHPERFLQTVAAIFGFQTVLQPAFVAVVWLLPRYMEDPVWKGPVFLLLFVIALWILAVNTRILKAATGWRQFACVSVVMLQSLVDRMVEIGLFPEAFTNP